MIDAIQSSAAWSFGARLTDLFDWNALGAIGTAGALALLVRQALAAARADAIRLGLGVTSAANELEGLRRWLVNNSRAGLLDAEGIERIRTTPRLRTAREKILATPMSDYGNAGVGPVIVELLSAISSIEDLTTGNAGYIVVECSIQPMLRRLDEAADSLFEASVRLAPPALLHRLKLNATRFRWLYLRWTYSQDERSAYEGFHWPYGARGMKKPLGARLRL